MGRRAAPPEDEPRLLAAILAALGAAGLTARAGLADTPRAAWALARHAGAPCRRIAAPGGTASALAPLPVEALDLGPAARRRLGRLGVVRIGEIAHWPDAALRRYLGAEIADRMAEALGRPAAPAAPAPCAGIVPFAARPHGRPARRSA